MNIVHWHLSRSINHLWLQAFVESLYKCNHMIYRYLIIILILDEIINSKIFEKNTKEYAKSITYFELDSRLSCKIKNWQTCPTELINHSSFQYFDTGKRENKIVYVYIYIVADRRKNLHKASTAKRKQTGQKVSMRRSSSIHSVDVVGQKK